MIVRSVTPAFAGVLSMTNAGSNKFKPLPVHQVADSMRFGSYLNCLPGSKASTVNWLEAEVLAHGFENIELKEIAGYVLIFPKESVVSITRTGEKRVLQDEVDDIQKDLKAKNISKEDGDVDRALGYLLDNQDFQSRLLVVTSATNLKSDRFKELIKQESTVTLDDLLKEGKNGKILSQKVMTGVKSIVPPKLRVVEGQGDEDPPENRFYVLKPPHSENVLGFSTGNETNLLSNIFMGKRSNVNPFEVHYAFMPQQSKLSMDLEPEWGKLFVQLLQQNWFDMGRRDLVGKKAS